MENHLLEEIARTLQINELSHSLIWRLLLWTRNQFVMQCHNNNNNNTKTTRIHSNIMYNQNCKYKTFILQLISIRSNISFIVLVVTFSSEQPEMRVLNWSTPMKMSRLRLSCFLYTKERSHTTWVFHLCTPPFHQNIFTNHRRRRPKEIHIYISNTNESLTARALCDVAVYAFDNVDSVYVLSNQYHQPSLLLILLLRL